MKVKTSQQPGGKEVQVPMILVGNKKDLPRQVSEGVLAKKAKEWNVPFIETSAKDDQIENIQKVRLLTVYFISQQNGCDDNFINQ